MRKTAAMRDIFEEIFANQPLDPMEAARRSVRQALRRRFYERASVEGRPEGMAVLLDGKPVPSCLTTLDEIEGRKIETIDGLANGGKLHPVQEAFVKENAVQCGYCVPGMIMATVGLLRRNPSPTRAQIIEGLNGNLCRCCGYVNILKAVQRAALTTKEAK